MTDFAEGVERHRGELRVHCNRVLGPSGIGVLLVRDGRTTEIVAFH